MSIKPIEGFYVTDEETGESGVAKVSADGVHEFVEDVTGAVEGWLDEHPEATTMVEDGSITEVKIASSFLPYIKNAYATPEMFGAVGDGKTDDTDAIQTAVDNNYGKTIVFSKKYLVSSTINTPSLDSHKVALRFEKNATLKAANNFRGDYLIAVGGKNDGKSNYPNSINDCGVYNATLDCNSVCGGLSVSNVHMGRVDNCVAYNVKGYGLYIDKSDNSSADAYVNHFMSFGIDADDVNNIGVYINSSDNKIYHVRVSGCHTGVYLNGGGNYLDDVHPLYVTSSRYDNYNTSNAFVLNADSNVLVNCYNDSFSRGIYLPNASTIWHATNFHCHWYPNTDFKNLQHTFIYMDKAGAFTGVVDGVILNFANVVGGTNKGLYCQDLYRAPHNEHYGIWGISQINASVDAMTNGLYDLLWRQDVTHFPYGGAKKPSENDTKFFLCGAVPAGTVVSGVVASRGRGDMVEFRAYVHDGKTNSWVQMENKIGYTDNLELAFAEPVAIEGTNYWGVYVKNTTAAQFTVELKNHTQPNLCRPFLDRTSTGVSSFTNLNILKSIN